MEIPTKEKLAYASPYEVLAHERRMYRTPKELSWLCEHLYQYSPLNNNKITAKQTALGIQFSNTVSAMMADGSELVTARRAHWFRRGWCLWTSWLI